MSDYLFAHPSFLAGMSRSLDLGGVFDDYNTSATPEQADVLALFSDWRAVGRDLSAAMSAADAEIRAAGGAQD